MLLIINFTPMFKTNYIDLSSTSQNIPKQDEKTQALEYRLLVTKSRGHNNFMTEGSYVFTYKFEVFH